MLRNRGIQRLVIGGGDGQHTALEVLRVIAAIEAFASARFYQFGQLRLDARRHHPQPCSSFAQQPSLAQRNLATPDDQHRAAFEVVEQREVFHGRVLEGRWWYGHDSHYGRDAPCRISRIRPDAEPR